MSKAIALSYLKQLAIIDESYTTLAGVHFELVYPVDDLVHVDYHIARTHSRYDYFVSKTPCSNAYLAIAVRVADHENHNLAASTDVRIKRKYVSHETTTDDDPFDALNYLATDTTRLSMVNVKRMLQK